MKEREKELIHKLSKDNMVLTYENRIKDLKAEIGLLKYGAGNNEKEWKSKKSRQQENINEQVDPKKSKEISLIVSEIEKVPTIYYE